MFFGWRMVGVSFAAQFLAIGVPFYSFPVLLKPLTEAFEVGRLLGSMPGTLASLAGIVVSPLVGRMIARFPLRGLMAAGALVMGLSFLMASHAVLFWQICAIYVLFVSFGSNALGAVTAPTLVVNWFKQRRAFALGISQMGVSLAGVAMPPLASWTLARGGFRSTYEFFGLALLAAAPLVWLAVVQRPEDRGLQPLGTPTMPGAPPAPPMPGSSSAAAQNEPDGRAANPAEAHGGQVTLWDALSEIRLWLVASSAGLCFMGISGVLQHGHAFATDAGYSNAQATEALIVVALGAAAGKPIFGMLATSLGERPAFLCSIAAQAVALLALPAGSAKFEIMLGIFFTFGLSMGGVVTLMSALLARCFGPRSFGAMVGYAGPVLVPFQMVGPLLAGWVFDTRGGYDLAIYLFAAALGLAAVALLSLRLPQVEPS